MALMTRLLTCALVALLLATPAQAALTTKLIISVVATETATADLATPSAVVAQKFEYTWASGTGANQANLIWSDTRTLAASATEDLDLAGVLTNQFGGTLTFARVKAIIIRARAANTNNVLVGGAAATQFVNWVSDATDKVVVRPGGLLTLIAPDVTGYAVGAGASDFLRIGNSAAGTSVDYDIVIIGASA